MIVLVCQIIAEFIQLKFLEEDTLLGYIDYIVAAGNENPVYHTIYRKKIYYHMQLSRRWLAMEEVETEVERCE